MFNAIVCGRSMRTYIELHGDTIIVLLSVPLEV